MSQQERWLACLMLIAMFVPNMFTIRRIPGQKSGSDCYCVTDEEEKAPTERRLVACKVCFREGQLFDQWNWTLARTKCQNLSMDLVALDSQALTDRAVHIIQETNMGVDFDWSHAMGTREGPYVWTGAVSYQTGQSGGSWDWTWLGGQRIENLFHLSTTHAPAQPPAEDEELVLGVLRWKRGKAEKIKPYIWGYVCGTPPEVKHPGGHNQDNDKANTGKQNQDNQKGDSDMKALVGGVVGACLFAVLCLVIAVIIIWRRRKSAVPNGLGQVEEDEVYRNPELEHPTSGPDKSSGWRGGTLPTIPNPDSSREPDSSVTYDNSCVPNGDTYDNTTENRVSQSAQNEDHTYTEVY